MKLITSFITHSVQPGTSFAATPTVVMFEELCSIASRLVARVPPQPSQRMKRMPEIDEPEQLDFISTPASDKSLSSNLNPQTTESFVSSRM
jgi:hypothetical protein